MFLFTHLSARKTLAFLFVFSNLACAETPDASVAPTKIAKKAAPQKHLDLPALAFEGKEGIFGQSCKLYISAVEHKHGNTHELEYLVKVDYKIHGQTAVDTHAEFFLYQDSNKKYLPASSTAKDSFPVLASILLKDKSKTADMNKYSDYIKSNELQQFLRIDFQDIDIDAFEVALESVLDDSTQFQKNKTALDQLQKAILQMFHNNHYDAVVCSSFKLKGLQDVEFNLNETEEEEEGDHDHDHEEEGHDHEEEEEEGHDHDHDHHGHEH